MSVSSTAHVQRRPVAIPVERNTSLIARIYLLELIEVYLTRGWVGEEAESDLILCIRFGQKVVEETPILQVDSILLATVGYLEEDGILFALDLVLYNCWRIRTFTSYPPHSHCTVLYAGAGVQ